MKKTKKMGLLDAYVSNYILLEKFTEDRTADTWKKELEPRLSKLNIRLGQVVSDLCGAIRAVTKDLGAEHIPELFHAQYEISKAVPAPLASQERSTKKALDEAEQDVKRVKEKPLRLGKKYAKKQQGISIREIAKQLEISRNTVKRHLKIEGYQISSLQVYFVILPPSKRLFKKSVSSALDGNGLGNSSSLKVMVSTIDGTFLPAPY